MTAAVAVVIGSAFVARTSRRQVAAQLVVAVAIVGALAWRTPEVDQFAVSTSVAAFGVPLAFVDARSRRLPNPLVLGLALALVIVVAAAAVADHETGPLIRTLVGAGGTAAFFLCLYLAAPGQLGGGDVKLAAPLGGALAWFGWPTLALGSLLPWLAAAIAVAIIGRGPERRAVPLGPFLIGGSLLGVLVTGG